MMKKQVTLVELNEYELTILLSNIHFYQTIYYIVLTLRTHNINLIFRMVDWLLKLTWIDCLLTELRIVY